MPSLGSSPSLTRASSGPLRRTPTRLLSWLTVYILPHSAASAPGTNQSSRGPGSTRSTAGRGSGCGARSTEMTPEGGPTGSSVPARSGSGPRPDSESVDRLPSTGSTAIPPRTAR